MLPSNGEVKEFTDKSLIDLPELLQEDGHSCVPVCIQMIFEHFREDIEDIPLLSIDEIGKQIGTTVAGTSNGSNLDNINELLTRTIPSLDFVRDHSYPLWDSVTKDVDEGKPVICWIESTDDNGKLYGHSVVVKGYENREVICNDPQRGVMRIPVEDFLLRWEEMNRFSFRVKIGERIERKITEYMEDDPDE